MLVLKVFNLVQLAIDALLTREGDNTFNMDILILYIDGLVVFLI